MAERRMCDVCGVRPAVTTMRRIAPGEPPRTEYLCEVLQGASAVGASDQTEASEED